MSKKKKNQKITADKICDEFLRLKNIESVFLRFLELTPDFIYIKDREHKFLYTSNSFANLAGYKSWHELVGKTDFDIFPQEHAKLYFEKEKEIILSGEHITSMEEPYYNENNKLCYVVSSKRAMYDENKKIIGLFGISRDITKRKELEIKLQEHANLDTLTNLYNRRFFLEQSKKLIELCKREKKSAVIYFIDLNDFKMVNDSYGHDAGDKILKKTSKRLKEKFRASDLICRFGGDEFLVFTIMKNDKKSVNSIKKSIKELIKKNITYNNKKIEVDCSVGVASFPNDSKSIDSLIRKADKRMYEDKK